MAMTSTRKRTPPPAAPEPADGADVLTTAICRAICALAVSIPGGPGTVDQILTGQLRLSREHAEAIIAAAEHQA